ncbi:hypothetical protein IEQ34_026406 [Dendrobium chrysotoxum]|uniref:F-box domain-containing protein n=1 Tax=Dendrobium chrysotoxum TaxID=161865 RepID=A0AAV7FMG2_DENCH|nr:hypothetical protein IEQ34_026406 [Dendrobium chrysotoxum]
MTATYKSFAEAWKADPASTSRSKIYPSPKLWHLRVTLIKAQEYLRVTLIEAQKISTPTREISLFIYHRESSEVRLTGHHKGKYQSSVHELHEPLAGILQSRWANLPPELLCDVIRRLEASESTCPSRKHVACVAVCRPWRELCKEIVMSPKLSGKLTFPVSLKQPGPRDGMIQSFIKRDKSKSTYCLYLCLSLAHLLRMGSFSYQQKEVDAQPREDEWRGRRAIWTFTRRGE